MAQTHSKKQNFTNKTIFLLTKNRQKAFSESLSIRIMTSSSKCRKASEKSTNYQTEFQVLYLRAHMEEGLEVG